MLVDISPKNVNVALVPTDEVSEKKLDQVIANTQAIYNKVGIKINFTKEKVLNINSVVSGNTIQTEKNTLTSTYSADQQSINSLYQSTESSYVLFVTDKTSSTGQQGYMRLNGQFGYVFKTGLDKTPAHELGHGIFKLEHPFEVYKTSESSTDLLMDYSSGTALNHQDWKQINDPVFKLYAFQNQSSGQSLLIKGLADDLVSQLITLPSIANACLSFAVGNGKFVKFNQATFSNFDKINIVDGVLKSIYLKENNSLGKIGGNYKFLMSYKPIKSVQNGASYEVVSTSDLVCVDCIRKDDKILKNTVKDKDNQSITTWQDLELTKKYTLLQDGQYIDCSSGMCVTVGLENNNYKTKTLSQTDCEQYLKAINYLIQM